MNVNDLPSADYCVYCKKTGACICDKPASNELINEVLAKWERIGKADQLPKFLKVMSRKHLTKQDTVKCQLLAFDYAKRLIKLLQL